MLSDQQRHDLAPCRQRMQVVLVALTSSVITMAAVALVFGPDPPAETPIVSYGALVMGLASLVAGPLVASRVAQLALASLARATQASAPEEGGGDIRRLANVYQTRLIVAAALVEGAALFNLVAYFLEGHRWSVAAAAILLLVLLTQFPTQGRVEQWVGDQLESLHQLRGFSA